MPDNHQPPVPIPTIEDRRRVEAIAAASRRNDAAQVARIMHDAEREGRHRTLMMLLADAYANEVHHDATLAIIELEQRIQRIDTIDRGEI